MSVDAFEAILVMAVFLGAIVQGFSGFAFSAVAGAILLQVQAPGLAIPLLMICSLLIQTYVLVRLRATLSLHGSLPYLVGGAGGVVLATLAFDRIDPHVFRQGFGAFLMVYALSTVVRPTAALLDMKGRPVGHTAVGFAGGLVGGLTAMPGAVLAIWCDAHAMPKMQQRSIVQPFIAAMQALALVFLMLKAPGSTGRLAAASAVRLAGAVRRLGAGPLPVRQGERSGLSPRDLRAAVLLRHRAGRHEGPAHRCGHRACRAARSAGRGRAVPRRSTSRTRRSAPGCRVAAPFSSIPSQAAPKRAGLCAGAVDALLYIGEVLEPDYRFCVPLRTPRQRDHLDHPRGYRGDAPGSRSPGFQGHGAGDPALPLAVPRMT